MLFKNKDSVISELYDEYIQHKEMGDDPKIDDYIKRCPPQYAEELRRYIEDWEYIVGWKFDGIDGLIRKFNEKIK